MLDDVTVAEPGSVIMLWNVCYSGIKCIAVVEPGSLRM